MLCFSGAGYLGCFLDSHMRDMPWTPMEDAKMTVDLCIQHCRLQGYPFAGVVSETFDNCIHGLTAFEINKKE